PWRSGGSCSRPLIPIRIRTWHRGSVSGPKGRLGVRGRELEESRYHLLRDRGEIALLFGVVRVPDFGVPNLGSIADTDHGELATESGVVAQCGGNRHAQLLIGNLGVRAGKKESHVVTSALARDGRLANLFVDALELALTEDEDAALLASSDDNARFEFIAKLC